MAVHSAFHNLHVQQTAAGAPAIHTAGKMELSDGGEHR